MGAHALHEQVDQEPLDGNRIVTDLVIARRLQPAQFQPVQRRLAGNRRAVLASCCQLARQHRHHRVVAQLVVVIEVLIAERDPKHPLRQQGYDLMLDQMLAACVVEARGKPLRQLDRAICRPKKQRPASEVIAPPSNPPTTSRPSTAANPNKSALHSVGIGALLESLERCCCTTTFADSAPRCAF